MTSTPDSSIRSPRGSRPVCRPAGPLVSLLLLTGSLVAPAAAGADEPAFDLRIRAPTGYESYPFVAVAEYSTRPLEDSVEGYSPAVVGVPTVWEQPIELVWDFGDGSGRFSTGERPVAIHRYEQEGTYTISLEMKTPDGANAYSTSEEVEVLNRPPDIRRTGAVEVDDADATVELTAEVFDTEEDPLTYTWDFGDGEMVEGTDLWRVKHRFPLEGAYPVTLTVVDDGDEERSRTIDVAVSDRGDGPAGAGAVEEEADAEGVISGFDASISGGLGTSVDGEIRSLGGVHLGKVSSGACRFLFTVWDPGQLLYAFVILDLAGIPPAGGTYRIARPNISVNFDPTGEHYARSRKSVLGPYQGQGLGEMMAPLAAVLPQEERDRLGDELGLELSTGDESRETRPPAAASPFGLEEHQGFETVGGTLEMTLVPHDRATGSFEVSLRNARDEPDPGLESLAMEGSFALDLEEARRDGMLHYDRCGTGQLGIEREYPVPDDEHVDDRSLGEYEHAFIGVKLDAPYDPDTVTEETFQVGYPEPGSRDLVLIEGRFVKREKLVWFVPETPLLGGVKYTARVKTGPEGVLSKARGEIADDGTGWHDWQFTTAVDFTSAKGGNLACHLFQSVRDAPLVAGKPAVARIYASWPERSQVHESAQVRSFEARVAPWQTRNDSDGPSVRYTFVRPDLREAHGIDEAAAKHTANLFGWTPEAGARSPLPLAVQVRRRPGAEWSDVYRTKCPWKEWEPKPELTFDWYMAAVGSWAEGNTHAEFLPVAFDVASRAETFAWQTFPFAEVSGRFRGVVHPHSEDVPFCILPGKDACARFCDSGCVAEILLQQVAASSGADMVLFFGPLDYFGGGQTFYDVGIDSPGVSLPGIAGMGLDAVPEHWDRIVHGLVHEMGHALWLRHLPQVTASERKILKKQRERKWQGIEGFRIARDGAVGWNKSSTEGNEEGGSLAPVMVPYTVPYREAFIARHHYLALQELLEGVRGGRWAHLGPVPGSRLASLDDVAMAVAVDPRDDEETILGLAGVLTPDGRLAVLGPLVREARAGWWPTRGELELVLLDEGGRELSRGQAFLAPRRGGEPGRGFRGSLLWHPEAARLEVRRDGEVLGGRDRSGGVGEASLEATGAGDRAGFVTVSWSAGEPDGDQILVSLAYSPDGGASWSALGVGLEPEGEMTIEPDRLEAGSAPVLRLLVNDGFDRTERRVALQSP